MWMICAMYEYEGAWILCISTGEKLTDDEVDALLTGIEDSQGQVNYEGMRCPHSLPPSSLFIPFWQSL